MWTKEAEGAAPWGLIKHQLKQKPLWFKPGFNILVSILRLMFAGNQVPLFTSQCSPCSEACWGQHQAVGGFSAAEAVKQLWISTQMYSIKPDPDHPGHQTGLKPRSPFRDDSVHVLGGFSPITDASNATVQARSSWRSMMYSSAKKSNILTVQKSNDKMRNYRGDWLTFWLAISGRVRVGNRTRTLTQSSHTNPLGYTSHIVAVGLSPFDLQCEGFPDWPPGTQTYSRKLRNVRNMINNAEDSNPSIGSQTSEGDYWRCLIEIPFKSTYTSANELFIICKAGFWLNTHKGLIPIMCEEGGKKIWWIFREASSDLWMEHN